MPRLSNDRVITFLQSIALQAVEAQEAFKQHGLLSDEVGDALNDIEYDLGRITTTRDEAWQKFFREGGQA